MFSASPVLRSVSYRQHKTSFEVLEQNSSNFCSLFNIVHMRTIIIVVKPNYASYWGQNVKLLAIIKKSQSIQMLHCGPEVSRGERR